MKYISNLFIFSVLALNCILELLSNESNPSEIICLSGVQTSCVKLKFSEEINDDNCQVMVTDIFGNLRLCSTLAVHGNSIEFDTSSFGAGVYIYSI